MAITQKNKREEWFVCTKHDEAHVGVSCREGDSDTCTNVGPFSSQEAAVESGWLQATSLADEVYWDGGAWVV